MKITPSQIALALASSLLMATAHAQKYSGQFSVEQSTEEQAPQAEMQDLSVQMDDSAQVVQTVSSLGQEMIGRIDWEKKVVYSVGDGVPPENAISPAQARVRAKRAAIDEAYARMLETIKEVRVDAESTTRNFVNESRIVQTRVSGLVKNAEIVELRQADDGSYQIMMKMPMDGPQGLNAALLPVQLNKITQKVAIVARSMKDDSGASETPAATPATIPEKTELQDTVPTSQASADLEPAVYTGLIVDARGLNVSPAAFPSILAQSGDVLYALTKVDPNAAVNGMCVYRKSLDAAKQVPQAGSHPLVVKAVDAVGSSRADLVLDDQDAERVSTASAETNFLHDAKVVVVID